MPNTPPPKRPATFPGAARLPSSIQERRPSAGVPSVEIEDPTPVDMPLGAVLERRAKKTQEGMDSTLTTVTTLRREVNELRDDHKKLDEKVDGIAMSSAKMEGMLTILVKNVETQHELVVHREKVTIEREATQEKLALEDEVDAKKFNRQKWLKILGVLAAIGTAIAGGITLLFSKCG